MEILIMRVQWGVQANLQSPPTETLFFYQMRIPEVLVWEIKNVEEWLANNGMVSYVQQFRGNPI